ncbi:outer membrane lipoprotein chaperone LolA [Larsenimonas salina]|uniref:outer membrane lipoprotein chaperone LolA n=1 Tax=Larsenimonas salina TaxID=1295565 RepID=UPI00255CC265|nr:outer membrane lipoprotein chaperone LolA [Larsenimonas salina]
MKRTLTMAAAAGLMMMSSASFADDSAAERLTTLLKPLNSYSADFEQHIVNEQGASQQDSSGHMWLSRPGRFRWEVNSPYRQVVVSNGQKVYMYDPDLEQVTIRPLDERVTHTPALLLSGQASELTENYSVSRRQQGGTEIFSLTPKSNDSLFEGMELTFRGDTLSGLDLSDSTGQRTDITFSNQTPNERISPDTFNFKVPDGADVIREGQ